MNLKTPQDIFIAMKILEILDQFKGLSCREDALINQFAINAAGVNLAADKLLTYLEHLRSLGFVVYEVPALGGPKRWRITPEGKTQYQQWHYENDFENE